MFLYDLFDVHFELSVIGVFLVNVFVFVFIPFLRVFFGWKFSCGV